MTKNRMLLLNIYRENRTVRSIVYGLLMCGALTRCKWYGNGKLLNEVSSNSTELVGV